VIKGFDITLAWPPEDADEEAFDDDGFYTKSDFRVITELEPLDGQVAYSEESLAKGKVAFEKSCTECHGDEGRGNILSGKKLEDDWGNRIWPRDLTKPWTWRATQSTDLTEKARDETIKAIYRRLSIGIIGTPMPAHRAIEEGNKDPVSLEDRWHIANYVYSLRDQTVQPQDGPVVTGMKLTGELPVAMDDERWQQAHAVTLHLVPNVIKEERLFTPLNDAVSVRALYNDQEIAFLLEVADRTESRPGIEYFTELQDENLEMHPDALAIQFPHDDAYMSAPMVEKPLYRHGDAKHKTTIWYWNAGSVEPKRDATGMLLDGSGPDKSLIPREDDSSLSANGEWRDGVWRVLMKRPRNSGNGDLVFNEGEFIPISFANWDGSNGEIGARHTLSTWYWLVLPPELDVNKVYGLPAGIALLVFLAGVLLVRSQRGKAGR
ncbi:MAG: ethylbenzene dehydrogenase-related protein, partial [Pseudomonadota bacterium]